MIFRLFLLLTFVAIRYQKEPLHFAMTSDFLPLKNCYNVSQGDAIFEGTEYEAMKEIFSQLNFTKNKDYDVSCLAWDQFLSGLEDPDSKVIDVFTLSRVPSTPGGLSVMFKFNKGENFIWKVVSPQMWLSLCFIVPVLLGLIVYFAEYPERRQYWVYYIYGVYNALLQADDTRFYFIAPKMVLYSFKILCLVFMTIYTSWLFTEVTKEKTFNGVLSPHDLRGRKVLTWDVGNFVTLLRQYKAIPIRVPITIPLANVIQSFRENNDVELFMIDTPVANYLANSSCDMYVALEKVYNFDYAPVFNKKTEASVVRQIELGTLKAIEKVGYDALWERYLASRKSIGCQGKYLMDAKTFHFTDFKDLFIMVWAAITAGVFIEIFLLWLQLMVLKGRVFNGVRRDRDKDLVSKMSFQLEDIIKQHAKHSLAQLPRFLQLNLKKSTFVNGAKVEEIRRIVLKTC